MSLIGNLIWIIFGGLLSAIGWLIAGCLLCITVIGIPFGLQCFKIAGLSLAPFGKEVRIGNFGAMGLIGIFYGSFFSVGNYFFYICFSPLY